MRNTAVIGSIREAFSGFVCAKITAVIQRKDSPIELLNLHSLTYSVGCFFPSRTDRELEADCWRYSSEGRLQRICISSCYFVIACFWDAVEVCPPV